MLEFYQDRSYNHTLAAWLRLVIGLVLIGVLFMSAVFATCQPPPFDVHILALDRGIDTNAFYYTDIEEFDAAEQWMMIHLGNSDKPQCGNLISN